MPFSQRKRGSSFKEEYMHSSEEEDGPRDVSVKLSRRSQRVPPPSSSFLLPPKAEDYEDRLTVVLDLDETLIYARENALYVRPYLNELLEFLAAHCETVVWTAAEGHYAAAVINQFDIPHAVHHLITRDRSWCSTAVKDLQRLGRPLDRTIIFENTPDCIRGFEGNAVLVGDYTGGELEDCTLRGVLRLLRELVALPPSLPVPQCLARASQAHLCEVPSDRGDRLRCYCLLEDDEEDFDGRGNEKEQEKESPEESVHTTNNELGGIGRHHPHSSHHCHPRLHSFPLKL